MNSEQIKEHFRKHKWKYIIGGSIILAGTTCLLMRKNIDLLCGSKGSSADKLPLRGQQPVINFHCEDTGLINFGTIENANVKVVERIGRGHPGYLTRCLENGQVYSSQAKAAADLDLNPTHISNQLNGLRDNVNGFHFERLYVTA